jgi:sugar O-acyltransferase (sialic acid O-acetyltransferase NeuD family)
MRNLLIIGAGGFGSEAAWIAREMTAAAAKTDAGISGWNILGFADSDENKRDTQHAGYQIHGNLEQAGQTFTDDIWFFCAIGNNEARQHLAQTAQMFGWKPATLIHPSAVIADTATVGAGSFVGPGAIVSCNACVGEHVIINMHVSVGHDVTVGDYCQLSPGSRLSGFCRLEDLAFLGSNAVLMPATRVGRGAVVGTCSLGRGQIDSNTTICGVPGRIVRAAQ